MKTFWNILKNVVMTLWQLPQILIGFLMACVLGIDKVDLMRGGRLLIYSKNMRGGISFGMIMILKITYYQDDSMRTENHEFGHARQSAMLGWLYLFVIGIPSIIWAMCYKGEPKGYYEFYTERWADKLGGVKRD